MKHTRTLLAAVVTSLAVTASVPALAGAATPYQPLPDLPSGSMRGTTQGVGKPATTINDALQKNGTAPVAPQGVNLWDCKPSADKPFPVILIHGQTMTANSSWAAFGPALKDQGYCVYAVNLPKDRQSLMGKVTRLVGYDFGGLTDIELSAAYTGAFVNEVLKSTGARKVDIVGYSEGGTVANLMAHNYGSAHFRKIVTIAGINVGINPFSVQDHNLIFTSPTQPALLGSIMTALSDSTAQMMSGSAVSEKLTHPDTVAGIDYTNISSKYDEFVVISKHNPNFQKAVPGATVSNIVLQDGCDKDLSNHTTIPYNKRVWAMVFNALAGKAVVEVPCLVALPSARSFDSK